MRDREILRKFIVLEGLDGAGTTTQSRLLLERLRSEGFLASSTCEPTSGPIGKAIRSFLKGSESFVPSTAAYLFAADRNEHVFGKDGIAERTAKGETVVSDRYFFSSLAYQAVDCDYVLVESLNSRFPLPEFLFFLEVPPEVAEGRMASRETREVYERLDFQQKVRDNYRKVLSGFGLSPMRILVVDGTLGLKE
ncbi:MAG: putative thymidylate kinase [Methanoregulaceae archaeon PtaU1.Bin222]|nr:MAG: putative thymidylate kinase [Methanoregulaceae archaeon PtaU1.Bin222]